MPRVETTPWARHRDRAETLRERYAHATEVLTLYLALLDVWEDSYAAFTGGSRIAKHAGVSRDLPTPSGAEVAAWAAEHVLPRVVAVTVEAGPEPLAESLRGAPVDDTLAAEQLLAAWLRGEELVPVERYLARSTLRGPLEGIDASTACAEDPAPRGDRHCPRCGGLPQLSFRSDTGDGLVNGSRQLQCARCGGTWGFASNSCVACGDSLVVYAEHRDGPQVGRSDPGDATFPHLRIEACDACRRYLIDVDLGHEPRAVSEVDELAALPLDLYAVDRGLTKITPNVMGF